MADDPGRDSSVPDDSWIPDGWDGWSQEQRTIWRRDRQLDGMVNLVSELRAQLEDRDDTIRALRDEIDELRRNR